MESTSAPMMGPPSMMDSPSPSTPGGSTQNFSQSGPNSASKRPPRKSTLTQQQKNHKRQRATPDQLSTLEMEFNKNPTPTAAVRDRIADEINMTERSVQIWFQNKRAKIKQLAKKSLENGEDMESIPESMRQYLAIQAMETGKGIGGSFLGRSGLYPYGNNMFMHGDQAAQSKVLIQHFTCRALSIGKWTRVGQNTMDLIVFYSPDKCTMTYYINNDQAGYKIEYPFSYIKNIHLENNDDDPTKPSGIVIDLTSPPFFFMDQTAITQGFVNCLDFTEDKQASQCLVHRLAGNAKVLSGQLAKLISLESFINRHAHQHMFDHNNLAVSAPVSPIPRPSSQPNFMAPPHVGMFQETWGISNMQPNMRAGPGHKRQRSRSVPMAVDFSMFQQPMPSFYIQQPGEAASQQSPNLYAPVPQQPANMGSGLRIDTQAGFGLDMRQYPMSATAASPADFSSPNYFAPPTGEPTPLPVSTPYSGSFLSPMANSTTMAPVISPLPFSTSPVTDSAIAEQSPPIGMMRPTSAEVYPGTGPDSSCAISDDGNGLGDMYPKQTMNLPIHTHSPASFVEPSATDVDMNHLVAYDGSDQNPHSLSPEVRSQMAQVQ
ncbi:Homeobox protein HOY1 [Ceratocystis fimbriata CBS 114723]|uniref:Homeobox protein HOY1 n=1 Tax=Ceratocystis fimbriata CBS 114723 TaxID=1035309 RepID=A0A2C5X255_9PEZI|nr:Homeobox protein HOY1 [Ceratocystis fimbriata CBS 114723]